jgi:RHS repeat-associated protein
VRKTVAIGANTYETTWTHDAAGRVLHMGYPSGTEVDYTRDGQGRITGVEVTPAGGSPTTIVSDVDYLPFGPISQITWGNAETMTRVYDQNYWIDQIDSTANGLDLEFTTDDAGNIVALSSTLAASPPDNTYRYDNLHRLIEAEDASNATVEAYTYDATGNRTSKQIGAGSPQSYVYPSTTPKSHKLLSVGGVSRSYDANGNTTSRDGSESITFDDRNRMEEYDDGTPFTYAYNARGERVRKSATGIGVEFAYNESGQLIAETDTVGADTRDIIWLDHLPIATFEPNTGLLAIEPDHLGSPRQLVDLTTDDVLWRWPIVDNPFGEQVTDEDPDADTNLVTFNLRFPGQYADAESGLSYNYFRDYEAGTGRYVESDPIGLETSISTYSYVDADPLSWVDSQGLAKSEIRYRWSECSPSERRQCEQACSPRKMVSCKRRWIFATEIAGDDVVRGWKPLGLSCNCEETFCDRNQGTCVAAAVTLATMWTVGRALLEVGKVCVFVAAGS